MKVEDFDLFAALVKQRSGLVLTRDKSYFLESRLLSVVRKHNLKSMDELAQLIRAHRDEATMADVTESMTSNETSFFRDHKTFAYIKQTLLPQLRTRRADKKHLRIWSIATSSGQEAYSLAMLCADAAADFEDWKIDIFATDISKTMVARAKAGVYTQLEVQRGLPIRMLLKYFQGNGSDRWQIKDGIRARVQFSESNLLHDFGAVGIFDFVLCRNVLSSFEELTQRRLLNSIQAVMAPDGVLLLGASENVPSVIDKFKPTGERGLYTLGAAEDPARQAVG